MSRQLLNRGNESLGIDQKVWIDLEDAYGVLSTTTVPTGAIEHINLGLKFSIPREDSASRSGRSLVTRLSGKKTVEVSLESYIMPGIPDISGNPTLPPLHPLYMTAFGKVVTSDPTKIVYELAKLSSNSFRILEEATHYSRLAVGCVMDKLTFSLTGDGKAQVKAEGFGQDVKAAGSTVLAKACTGVAQAASKLIQNVLYTAVTTGQSGNLINIAYTAGGTAGSEAVTVVGNAISVQIESGVSTATQIVAAVSGTPAAAALVTPSTSSGSTVQTAPVTATYLTGGLGVADIQVATGKGELFEVDAYIDIFDKDDGTTAKLSAKKILSISGDYLTTNATAITADANDIVIGHAPNSFAPVSSENALLGLKGSFTVAGVSVDDCSLISAEIAITNNYTKKDFVYGTSQICGYVTDKRRNISVKLEVLLTKDNFAFYMRNKKFIAEDIVITLEPQDIPSPSFSTSTGRTYKFAMPRVEFNIPPIEQPGDKYVTLSLEGVAMANSMDDLDSELTLTIE